jgi:hypothetical protein
MRFTIIIVALFTYTNLLGSLFKYSITPPLTYDYWDTPPWQQDTKHSTLDDLKGFVLLFQIMQLVQETHIHSSNQKGNPAADR